MTTLREELAEIIRWRFRSADGKPLNGPSVVQRAMEIADELAPFIEDAVGWDDAWDDAAVVSPYGPGEAVRCVGCGYQWPGPWPPAHLCGDCWRKAQPVLHGPAPEREAVRVCEYSEQRRGNCRDNLDRPMADWCEACRAALRAEGEGGMR